MNKKLNCENNQINLISSTMATNLKSSSQKRNRYEDGQHLAEGSRNYMLRSKKVRLDFTQKKKDTNKAQENTTKNISTENTTKSTPNPKPKTKRAGKSSKIQLLERIRTEVPTKEYLINEIILTTVPGYQPWPSRILDITGQTIVVEFFGTGQM